VLAPQIKALKVLEFFMASFPGRPKINHDKILKDNLKIAELFRKEKELEEKKTTCDRLLDFVKTFFTGVK
jgi:hypothetical protein